MEEVKDVQSMFEKLNSIDVSKYTEKKQNLTYLSWANAWAEFKKVYPEATYIIKKTDDGVPYFGDFTLGYMVYTEVTAGGLTYEMWLPVMDGNNKAMKLEPWTYKVKEWKNGKPTGGFTDKHVAAMTMFDVNKTIMRCLVKNLAMFGLGLYIYAGEDLPEKPDDGPAPTVKKKKATSKKPADKKPPVTTTPPTDPVIDDVKYATLIARMAEAGVTNKQMNSVYKVKDVKELKVSQYIKAMKKLDATIEKHKKEQVPNSERGDSPMNTGPDNM